MDSQEDDHNQAVMLLTYTFLVAMKEINTIHSHISLWLVYLWNEP